MNQRQDGRPTTPRSTLLNSRYPALARNTIDYWMLPDDPSITEAQVCSAIETAPVLEDASLQVYIHVPFCAQSCRFCAFSGGNSLNFKEADRFARLVVLQLRGLLEQTRIRGQPIRSVNIGGGSPDLLNGHIGHVLSAMRDLPGCSDDTEFSVEFTLSTTKREFIEALAEYGVTKASFGIQSLDPKVRGHMRQPKSLQHLEQVLRWIDGRIPIVNADLITGLPGQSLRIVHRDLTTLMEDPRINGISTYLLTPGAAPSLIAGVEAGEMPRPPAPHEQAAMRLHSYTALLRAGWIRKGTNSYYNPSRMSDRMLDIIAGNECIGASHYEAFLLAAGPQAISFLPGARVENRVDIEGWTRAMENGEHPYHLPKCSTVHQKDTALWVFPLRWEGLPQARYDRMVACGAVDAAQEQTLAEFVDEGLVAHGAKGYELTVLGEVFMGHLVHDLKSAEGQKAVEDYIREGETLGHAIANGRVPDANMTNNRQIALPLLSNGPPADA